MSELDDPSEIGMDERARRALLDEELAALCDHGHPIAFPVEGHLTLFLLLDWPRRHGLTIAARVAAQRAAAGAADAPLMRSLSDARLALVRTTQRAGERVGFQELSTGRARQGVIDSDCTLGAGELILGRFAEVEPDLWAPVSDLLVMPESAVDLVRAHAPSSPPPAAGAPNERVHDAVRLFRCWTSATLPGVRRDHAACARSGRRS
ncbi:MAG: hypothetical protein R3F49_06855 [Planctomycetota bacterium]